MQYSSVTIDNLEFNYNDGGAVSLYQSSEFQINDSTFYGNRADSGGAISISIGYTDLEMTHRVMFK